MRTIGVLTRATVRRQWRSILALALVAGLGGGFALTAAAGARRASTSWERLREVTLAPDVLIQAREGTDPALLDVLRRQPGIAAAGNFVYTPVAPEPLVPGVDGGAFIAMDPFFGDDVYRPVIEAGRRANSNRADEVTVNRDMANAGHIKVGQRVRLRSGFDATQLVDLGEVTVVGIHKGTFDVGVNAGNAVVLLGYRFLEAHREDLTLSPEPAGLIRLTDGLAGTLRVEKQAREIWGDAAAILPSGNDEAVIVDAVNVQVIALGLLALAAGLATAVATGQALGRLVTAAQPDTVVLRALGLRRREVAAVSTAPAVLVATIAAVLAVVISIGASTAVPTGLAKKIEPSPGVHIDVLISVVGAAALIGFLGAVGAVLAWRTARRDAVPALAEARPVPALPPSAALGLHWTMAATPGPAATSARSALVAAAIGTAGVVAVVTFAASLSHFLGTDRLYGWDFQAAYVGEPEDPSAWRKVVQRLAAEPAITGIARGSIVRLGVGGAQMEVWALKPAKGSVHPTVLRGTAPVGSDEIMLGEETIDALELDLGDHVEVAGDEGERRFRVVGTAVFPELGNVGDLANNALITADGLVGLGGAPVAKLVLLGGSRRAAVNELVRDATAPGMEMIEPFQPARVKNIKQVGGAPWLLAALFAGIALAAVTHALVLSVRHRRRDMAVLRSLGMRPTQLRRAVTVQATATAIAGAVVGVPLGIVVGRASWSAVASGLGVLNRPVVPPTTVALLVVVSIGSAAAVALVPALRAGWLRPAELLRTE